MAKLAVILPHENLRDTMRMLLRMMRMEHAVILQYSGDYNDIPALVSQAKRQGIDIILTRGLVAERRHPGHRPGAGRDDPAGQSPHHENAPNHRYCGHSRHVL